MLSADSRNHSIGFKFVNEMLNISYLSGWVRKPSKEGFLLQQTNSLAHAIFITVDPGTRIPKETTPVTVVCHAYGKKRDDGKSVVELIAIDIKKPSSRSMPIELVWNSSLAEGVAADAFQPFKSTHHGGKEQQAYISVLLRQHRDASLAIPIRVYEKPEMLAGILRTIPVGYPVSMVGQVNIKVIPNNENIQEIADSFLHIRTRSLSGVTKGVEIKQEPVWWGEMARRIVAERKDRQVNVIRPVAQAASSAIFDPTL